MLRRSIFRFCIAVVSIAFIGTSISLHAQDSNTQHARKYKAPPPSARIEVTVVKDFNGKPIADAHVIFHPIEGDKDKGYLELKTDEDGKAIIDVLPIGDTVRMQIIANGYQTYGEDYKVEKAEMAKEVRMKRPGAQYSIYKDSTTTTPKSSSNSGSNNSGSDKSSAPSQNSNSSGDKSSGSSSDKSDAPPSGNPPQSN